jgi:hypothetical protein
MLSPMQGCLDSMMRARKMAMAVAHHCCCRKFCLSALAANAHPPTSSLDGPLPGERAIWPKHSPSFPTLAPCLPPTHPPTLPCPPSLPCDATAVRRSPVPLK